MTAQDDDVVDENVDEIERKVEEEVKRWGKASR